MGMPMKRGLMSQFPSKFNRDGTPRAVCCKNIGDYVQTVASMQYAGADAELIEQEEADQYSPADKQKRRMIMNGWFQWRAEHWPPSEFIEPLLISMHFSPLRAEQLLSPRGVAFLRAHQPIGCRDLGTKKLLETKGLECYFSACLTLTLGKKYGVPQEQRDGVYVVDPFFDIPPLKGNIWSFVAYCCRHPIAVCKLGKKTFFRDYSPTGFLDRNHVWYRRFYKAMRFLNTYEQAFSIKLLVDAEYITHWMDIELKKTSAWDCVHIAEDLIKRYGAAKMMITSRIHAGLPCLAMETPVVFIANKEITDDAGTWNTPGRLGGLLEFFRILKFADGRFSTDDDVLSEVKKITQETSFKNKDDWKDYARELDKKCSAFMK